MAVSFSFGSSSTLSDSKASLRVYSSNESSSSEISIILTPPSIKTLLLFTDPKSFFLKVDPYGEAWGRFRWGFSTFQAVLAF